MKRGTAIPLVNFHDNLMIGKFHEPMRSISDKQKIRDYSIDVSHYDETFLSVRFRHARPDQNYVQLIPWAQVAGAFFPVDEDK